MSQKDGKYEYESDCLDWLQNRHKEYMSLFIQSVNCEGPVYRDTLIIMIQKFGFNPEEARGRIQAWVEWLGYSWSFLCNCRHKIRISHYVSKYGCVCGAVYSISGWEKYTRDNTPGECLTF